ncbi:bifunctional riboflavin kinase/FAD synthetase [Shewanella marina]|uniref:bifunctional riboflavin kinase/FAD synthetase n=1 Tax=Shewanella marina TaxID=487319 RepID=UPI00046EAD98|nr:bifunctional riboflavin kinase/FAD synthetase [Shewanella marina]
MELIRGIHNILPRHHGCVLTIGNFDGVHRGHAAVLAQLIAQGEALNLPTVVMTFEPQPQELFNGSRAPARLNLLIDKFNLLAQLGIDRLLCVRFTQAFASQPAEQFVKQLLVDKLGVKYLVVGDDFCFGKNRQGNFAMLVEAGAKYGFTVVSTQSFLVQSQRVSSTMIRNVLAAGDVEQASELLGHPYCVSGRVFHGRQLGRTIGFPTANVALKRNVVPVNGVFAVKVRVQDGNEYLGVANIGHRPTVNGQTCQLEVHLFDFSGDLYGQRISVTLVAKIRDEQKFASLDALKLQILHDVDEAKALFCLQRS